MTWLWIFMAFSPLMSQSAIVRGVVMDASDDIVLVGVNIVNKKSEDGIISDEDGRFDWELEPGKVVLEFSYVGYDTHREILNLFPGQEEYLEIKLMKKESLLEAVVVTASKFEKKLGEETVSLDVIQPRVIENQNLVSIDQAVERNPGVTMIDRQVNIRGGAGYSYGAGSRVQVLLDGLPILQADAGFPNWSSIPIENLGQIEVIKGASSALYGSAAMNGIINVRTAYPSEKPITKISLWGGGYIPDFNSSGGQRSDWWNLTKKELEEHNRHLDDEYLIQPYQAGMTLGHRQKIGKLDLVVGALLNSHQDQRYFGFDHYGRMSINSRYRLNDRFSFGINGLIQNGNSGSFFLWNGNEGVDRYLPARITGEPTRTKYSRFAIDPHFTYQDESGNIHKILSRWYKVDNQSNNDQGNFSNFFYLEYQYQKNWNRTGTTMTTGIVGNHVDVKAPLYQTGPEKQVGRNYSVYIQLEQNIWEKVDLTFGGRIENHQTSGVSTETKPVLRAGVNYQAADYTYLRASFGQGYRFPTIAERFINTSLGGEMAILPNPSLLPESGITAEIGWKQGLKWGAVRGYADIAGFYSRYVDMMEFNPTNDPEVLGDFNFGFQSQNVGNTKILGLESSIRGEGHFSNGIHMSGWVGYTFLVPSYLDWEEVKDESSSEFNILKYRFRHTFTGSWDFGIKRWNMGVSTQYFSFMENVDQVFLSFVPGLLEYRNSRKTDPIRFDPTKKGQYRGDFIVDGRVSYSFPINQNSFKVSMIVKNINNHSYSLRPGMMEAPLSWVLRMDLSF